MKSLHTDAPPAKRPVPEVWGKLFGKGQAVLDGSGRVGAVVLAAAGTSLGIPAGTFAWVWAAKQPRQAAMATNADKPLPPHSTRRLIAAQHSLVAQPKRR